MPKRKKHNMSQASLDNLRPGEYKFTKEDSAKGGRVSQRRRSAQAAAQRLLGMKLTPKQIKQYELMGQKYDGDETGIDILMAGQIRAAIDGSEKCARLILEYAGEKVSRGESTDLLDLLEIIRQSTNRDDEDDTES